MRKFLTSLLFLTLFVVGEFLFAPTAVLARPLPTGPQCIELFRKVKTHSPYSLVLAAIQLVNTDRPILFTEHKDKTVEEFLLWVAERQNLQLRVIQNLNVFLPEDIIRDFKKRFHHMVDTSFNEMAKLQLNYREVKTMTMAELLNADSTLKKELETHIMQIIVNPNTLLAEYLTAIYYRTLLASEKPIPELIGESWSDIARLIRPDFESEEAFHRFSMSTMDLQAISATTTLWVEVKYLGRDKEYAKASGNQVLEKLKRLKKTVSLLHGDHQVVLALVGPGQLNEAAIAAYVEAGIQVNHITARWSPKTGILNYLLYSHQ